MQNQIKQKNTIIKQDYKLLEKDKKRMICADNRADGLLVYKTKRKYNSFLLLFNMRSGIKIKPRLSAVFLIMRIALVKKSY